MTVPRRNDWLAPGPILGLLGMLGAIAGAWMSFDSRITRVEQARDFDHGTIVETRQDVKDINAKLDRLIERGK